MDKEDRAFFMLVFILELMIIAYLIKGYYESI